MCVYKLYIHTKCNYNLLHWIHTNDIAANWLAATDPIEIASVICDSQLTDAVASLKLSNFVLSVLNFPSLL